MNDAPKVADAGGIPERFLRDGEFWGLSWRQQVGALRELAALEAENRQLKEQVRKLSAPVSDEEWKAATRFYDGTDHDYDEWAMEREELDAVLTRRTQEPAQTEGK